MGVFGARAPEGSSRGNLGKERGNEGLFVGVSREDPMVATSAVNARVAITDKALLVESSRYVDPLSFSVGAWGSFSTPSSIFSRALVADGSSGLGGLVVVEREGNQDLLRIILADDSSWEVMTLGRKALVEVRVGDIIERIEDEGPLQEAAKGEGGGGGAVGPVVIRMIVAWRSLVSFWDSR